MEMHIYYTDAQYRKGYDLYFSGEVSTNLKLSELAEIGLGPMAIKGYKDAQFYDHAKD